MIFNALPGTWKLARNIPGQGAFIGRADFTPLADGRLSYVETGTLNLDTGSFESARKYIYVLSGDRIDIYYDDPHRRDVMQELTFINGVARHTHLCGADTYDLTWVFWDENTLSMAYQVHGPKKSYRLETTLTRPRKT